MDVLYFFIFYSFIGWAVETIFVSVIEGHPVNTGLLDGPFSPIYGFGALLVIIFVAPFQDNLLLFLGLSIVITSILEYLTSFFFEKVFHVTWWDYSNKPFNLHGRICLEASIYWGILSILALVFIHPKIIPFIVFLSHQIGSYGILIFLIYFFIDSTNALQSFFKPKNSRSINSFHNLKLRN